MYRFRAPSKHKKAIKLFATLPKRVSSSALILEDENGAALVVKANYKSYWNFPGGVIDPGETPKQAAVRETLEEVGIVVDPDKLEFVAVLTRSSKIAETYQFIFKAQLNHGDVQTIKLQASEIDEYALVSKQQAIDDDSRRYAKAVTLWVNDEAGYVEHIFG